MKLWAKILLGVYIAFLVCIYIGECVSAVSAHRLVQRSVEIEKNRRLREESRHAEEIAAKAKCDAEIDAEVRAFMMNEAPAIKQCLDRLQAESTAHKEKIDELRRTLRSFGRNPEQDGDFKSICSFQRELLAEIENVSNRLISAYIASVKYNVAPSRKGLSELRASALRDGIDAATSAFARYEKMKGEK